MLNPDGVGDFIITSDETILIPEESWLRFLDHFWAFCRNWNRNRSQNESKRNHFFWFTIPHFRDRQNELCFTIPNFEESSQHYCVCHSLTHYPPPPITVFLGWCESFGLGKIVILIACLYNIFDICLKKTVISNTNLFFYLGSYYLTKSVLFPFG